ncbi:MAG: peptidoglycan DD-metalloendopeptidase family protein [Gammaproteobacteria bacterium]
MLLLYLRDGLKPVLPAIAVLLCHACTTALAPVTSKSPRQDAEPTISGPSARAAEIAKNTTTHIVNKGDTLYSIAWFYSHDYRTLARWNRIAPPYTIFPGQRIRLRPTAGDKPATSLQPGPIVRSTQKPQTPQSTQKPQTPQSAQKPQTPQAEKKTPAKNTAKPPPPVADSDIKWQWPTRGKLQPAIAGKAGKGATFGGKQGQAIVAAAAGEVVYSGSGLLGYGKLVIIKHNQTFLSAYAYNKKILVSEGDTVKRGQRIATMGTGIKGSPTLHFEIRKNGKPTNPLRYLPRRKT